MRIFAEGGLSSAIEGQKLAMREEVQAEPTNKLLNVNEAEYIEYLVEKYRIEPLDVLWDAVHVSAREETVPAEHFPHTFNVYAGKSYPIQVVKYHIPFTGERDLLKMKPSSSLLWTTEVDLAGDEITFDILNFHDDREQIKHEAEAIISKIRSQSENVMRDVEQFNNELPAAAETVVKSRKAKLLKQANLLEGLGVPIKRSEHTPDTFAVDKVKRKVIVKATASNVAYSPEPTLDMSVYKDILKVCRDTGVEMERHPSVYEGKDEESLRDLFIMVLSSNFDSVTGETFNKKGKTDILIRHESSNVFVAECKFWSGEKAFGKTIDQALGYLTWRDSRAAIILFVRNKELGPVLDQVGPAAEAHPCYVSTGKPGGEGWFNFDFHLLEDSSRGVSLAMLCFHLPSGGEY